MTVSALAARVAVVATVTALALVGGCPERHGPPAGSAPVSTGQVVPTTGVAPTPSEHAPDLGGRHPLRGP